MTSDPIAYGRLSFMLGSIHDYRMALGLSKAAVADILGVSITTLYRWESYGMLSKLNDRNAEMVTLFCNAARAALDEYPDFTDRFITHAVASQRLGVTHEWLLRLYREGRTNGEDFGILGIFYPKEGHE